jgi:hypothetical protein
MMFILYNDLRSDNALPKKGNFSTALVLRLLAIFWVAACNSCAEFAILTRFERRWRSSAGRASDL